METRYLGYPNYRVDKNYGLRTNPKLFSGHSYE